MIEFSPPATQAPVRLPGGTTTPGRHTTTQEQREAAIEFALSKMDSTGDDQLRVKIEWTRGSASILEVVADVEHLGDKPIHVMRQVKEFTLAGVEVKRSAAERGQMLTAEVAELVERDML